VRDYRVLKRDVSCGPQRGVLEVWAGYPFDDAAAGRSGPQTNYVLRCHCGHRKPLLVSMKCRMDVSRRISTWIGPVSCSNSEVMLSISRKYAMHLSNLGTVLGQVSDVA
jgi:hypothetical protein